MTDPDMTRRTHPRGWSKTHHHWFSPHDNAMTTLSPMNNASLLDRVVILARDIKLSHTVFALPFAVLAAFLAAADGGRLPGVAILALIVVCMVLARTTAMAVNRWADANLDAHNPRTLGRAIPSGRLSPGFMLATASLGAAGFVLTTAVIFWTHANAYPLALSPFVLVWLGVYSFTKRFTWWCHLYLGSALALSPLAAAIAVRPAYLHQTQVYLLAMMVTAWVAGFDVIYALQDVPTDRRTGVYSMPARLGIEPALWVSRFLHTLAVGCLLALGNLSPVLGRGFTIGTVLVTALLVLEHTLVGRSHTRHIHTAFFTINGGISLLLSGLGIADVALSLI